MTSGIQGAIALCEKDHWTEFLERIKIDHTTFRKVKRGANDCLINDEVGKTNHLAALSPLTTW